MRYFASVDWSPTRVTAPVFNASSNLYHGCGSDNMGITLDNKSARLFFPSLLRESSFPNSANYTKVRNFGNFSRLLEKKRRRRTIKIGFYFFIYEWSRRRLSLIKMINGVEEVLILLFTAFRYEYLFWSDVVRAWIVRLFIREKILFVEKTHDEKSWRMAKVDFSWIWQKIREKKEKKGDSRLGTKSMLITFLGKLLRH